MACRGRKEREREMRERKRRKDTLACRGRESIKAERTQKHNCTLRKRQEKAKLNTEINRERHNDTKRDFKRDKLESISGKGFSPKNFKFHEKVQN